MPECKLIIRDAVNVRFEGLDVSIRKKLSDKLRFMVPHARHMPEYKLGRWDGTVSFCSVAGNTYLNLLDRLLPVLEEENVRITVDDRRAPAEFYIEDVDERVFADKTWGPGHALAGQPIMLRDYQVAAIRTFADNLQSIQALATGSGKTLITAALSSIMEPHGRSVIIVPNKSLVVQTEEDYRSVGLDVGVFYGDRKEWGHKHTICTWQSLSVFSKRKKGDTSPSIMDFIAGVNCVIIDEVHFAKSAELKSLLCGPFSHVPVRWGLTGTIPKAEHEALSLLASIGPVVGGIRAAELQGRGVLANCNIEIIETDDKDVEFVSYDQEHDYLLTDQNRLRWLASFITGISGDKNTLVLVDRIETGRALQRQLPDSVFVHGTVKTKDRKKEYDEIQQVDGKIIIATYGVAAVGLNIPRLFNCVLFQPGKSFTRIIQSIGRILRRAQDKTTATVYDISSNLRFAKKHLSKRKEYYREAEYPFVQRKVRYDE